MSDEVKDQVVDLSDPSLSDEAIAGYNASVNPFEALPPIDDGWHIMRVTPSEKDQTKRWKKAPDGSFKTKLILIVADEGPFKDRQVFENMCSTKAGQGGGVRAAGIILALGENPKGSHREMALQLNNLLNQELLCKVETRWEFRQGQSDNGTFVDREFLPNKKKLVGQDNAPKTPDGRPNHVIVSAYDGDKVVANAVPIDYRPLSS